MFAALASLSALAELARLSLQNRKPRRCANSGPGRVENPWTYGDFNMCKIRAPGRGGNRHRDLPLFRFAAGATDNRRLSYAERVTQRHAPGRPLSTVRLYARLAGFKVED